MTAVDYTSAQRVAAGVVARDELSRRRLGDFIELLEPTYERARHTVAICDHLEALERGEIERLMIFMPPRHGKTMHVSQAMPAWVLGRNPRAQIILASYGAELAEGNSRKARSYMRSERWPFECKVSEESRAQNRWQTDAGGILIATGCQGGLTGYGADRLIIDDPIRDRAEAESESMRESLWAWYSDVARTRLMPSGRIILCETRWHDDDLAGRILNSDDANRWTILSLPAIAEENDGLGRVPGEALWPERFPVDALPSVERGEMTASSFAALYQQSPYPASGNLFRQEWMQNRYDAAPGRYGAFRVMVIDGAWSAKSSADFSALACWASDQKRYYIVESKTRRVEFPDLVPLAIECYREWKPHAVVAEAAASGIPLVQMLARESSIPIIGITPRGSKEARVQSVTPLFESQKVWLPKSAPWLDAWMEEHLRFPAAKHDDQVDCTSLALSYLQEQNMEAEAQAERASQWRRFSMAR
jgi:predicted phage terminase large subunit-like protein